MRYHPVEEALWFAFARGVDYVERIENDSLLTGAPYTAALLAMRFAQAHFDLICCGDETLDNSSAIVGPLLAEILELPQVTGVLRLVEHSGPFDCGGTWPGTRQSGVSGDGVAGPHYAQV